MTLTTAAVPSHPDAPPYRRDRHRALIVTGSYGAGHDAAADEIRIRMLEAGWDVDVIDVADLYPLGLGHMLRRAYFRQLHLAPGTWGALLRALDVRSGEPSRAGRRACRLSGRLPARRVVAAMRPGTGLAVATHPFACQALGFLRERGLLRVPAVTYLTDASVHPLWVHRSVDLHVALHEEAARQTRLLGVDHVQVVEPLTPQVGEAHGNERTMLRSALGLPSTATIALISSGSVGVGDVHAAACDVRDTGRATPVVLCGRNRGLRRDVEHEPGVIGLGWLDGLTDVIRGADCLIQNSGGFTSLQALALGTPLISYRPLPGHGEANAEALRTEGLAPWPRTAHDLGSVLDDAITGTDVPVTGHWAERRSLLDALALEAPLLATR